MQQGDIKKTRYSSSKASAQGGIEMREQGVNAQQHPRRTLREFERNRVLRNRVLGLTTLLALTLGGSFWLLRTRPFQDILAVEAASTSSAGHIAPSESLSSPLPASALSTSRAAATRSNLTLHAPGTRHNATHIESATPELLPDDSSASQSGTSASYHRRRHKRHSQPTPASKAKAAVSAGDNKTTGNVPSVKQPQPTEPSEPKPTENTGKPPDDVPNP